MTCKNGGVFGRLLNVSIGASLHEHALCFFFYLLQVFVELTGINVRAHGMFYKYEKGVLLCSAISHAVFVASFFYWLMYVGPSPLSFRT